MIQQYFDLFHLNAYYVEKVAPTQYKSLINGYPRPRPVGLIGNPNELGFLYVISSLSTFYFFWSRLKLKYCFVFLVQVMMILLTLSRGAFVSLVCGVFFFVFCPYLLRVSTVNIKRLFFVVFFCMLIVSLGFLMFLYEPLYTKLTWRFLELIEISASASWLVRLESWQKTFAIFLQNPIMGSGPLSRAGFTYAVDNEWLLLLRSYGILGSVYFVLMFTVHCFHKIPYNFRYLGRLISAVLVSSSVFMVPAFVYSSLELTPILLVILASRDFDARRFVLKI